MLIDKNDSDQEGNFRAVAYLLGLLHELELYLLESLTHNWKYLTHNFLVTLTNLAVELLAGYQLFILRELELHFLSLQHVNVVLKHHTDLFKDFAEFRTKIR